VVFCKARIFRKLVPLCNRFASGFDPESVGFSGVSLFAVQNEKQIFGKAVGLEIQL